MKRKLIPFLIKVFAAALTISALFTVPASAEAYTTYTYSYDARYQISPDAFRFKNEISVFDGLALKAPSCVASGRNGEIYISDTGNNRIVFSDKSGANAVSVTGYTAGGKRRSFSEPGGLCVTEEGLIYVADTGNAAIVVLNPDGSTKNVLEKPDSIEKTGNFSYVPVAVSVDSLNRVFVLSRDTAGIILMDSTGAFQGVIGAQNVTIDISDYIWRMFMTKEQVRNSKQYVPITYNNLSIDSKGFLFVTSYVENGYSLQQAIKGRSAASDSAPVKKLTSDGTDVLKRNGFFPPVGDINFEIKTKSNTDAKTHSAITAVTVRENDVYSLADSRYGKIFTYDENGDLLYAFGGLGSGAGLFEKLASITYRGTDLLALDSGRGSLTVFEMTEYGNMLDEVISLQKEHRYDEVAAKWETILEKNNNFDLAYYGIGKSYLDRSEYPSAMEYFKLINNKTYYSKAFGLQREKLLGKYFLLIPIVLAAAVFALVKFFGFAKKYNRARRYTKGKSPLADHCMYSAHVIFHPFDAFNDIKFESRGGVAGATIMMSAAIISLLINTLASGYLFKSDTAATSGGVISALGNVLIPLALFMLSNWCLTSLMDGKGTMKDIYVTIGYSLTPMILLLNTATVMSHILTAEEGAFISAVTALAYLWSVMLIFFGTMTVHDYGLGKNILVCLLSVVGIAVMLFLILLFFSVVGRITTFLSNLFTELSFRI